MKDKIQYPKSIFFIILLSLIGLVGLRYCLPHLDQESTAVILDKMIPENPENLQLQKRSNEILNPIKRTPASIPPNQEPTLLKDKSSNSLIDKVESMYFKSLPSYVKWKVTPIKKLAKGQQIKINLTDNKEGKSTSYHALIDERTGRIITTWDRQRIR